MCTYCTSSQSHNVDLYCIILCTIVWASVNLLLTDWLSKQQLLMEDSMDIGHYTLYLCQSGCLFCSFVLILEEMGCKMWLMQCWHNHKIAIYGTITQENVLKPGEFTSMACPASCYTALDLCNTDIHPVAFDWSKHTTVIFINTYIIKASLQ